MGLSSEQIAYFEEIRRQNTAARYKNLSKESKADIYRELVEYFGSSEKANNALRLYENGQASSPEEAEENLKTEESKDHPWGE